MAERSWRSFLSRKRLRLLFPPSPEHLIPRVRGAVGSLGRQRCQELIGRHDWTLERPSQGEEITVAGDQVVSLANDGKLEKDYVEQITAGRGARRLCGHGDGAAGGKIIG